MTASALVYSITSGFLRRGDIAVGNDRDFHLGLYRGDGVIFRMSRVGASAGASMNGQCLNPSVLGNMRHGKGIFMLRIPAGAYFQGDWNVPAPTTASSILRTSG